MSFFFFYINRNRVWLKFKIVTIFLFDPGIFITTSINMYIIVLFVYVWNNLIFIKIKTKVIFPFRSFFTMYYIFFCITVHYLSPSCYIMLHYLATLSFVIKKLSKFLGKRKCDWPRGQFSPHSRFRASTKLSLPATINCPPTCTARLPRQLFRACSSRYGRLSAQNIL